MRVFPLTKLAIEQAIKTHQDMLHKATKDKSESGHTTDGDMMDDPLMHQQMEYVAMLQVKIRTLRNQLASLEYLVQSEVTSCDEIKLGHRIRLKVRYGDGDKEEYFATIGSTLDQQFLGTDKTYFDGTKELLLSDETPIVQYLLGRAAGERVTYESPGGVNKVHIISVEPSPLLVDGGLK